MTGDYNMLNSLNSNSNEDYGNITFANNGKDQFIGLGKIAISNDLSISNVLLVESLNSNLLFMA